MLHRPHAVQALLAVLIVVPLAPVALAHPLQEPATGLDAPAPAPLASPDDAPLGDVSDTPDTSATTATTATPVPAAPTTATSSPTQTDPLSWFGVESQDTALPDTAPAPRQIFPSGGGGSAGPGETNDITFVCPDSPNGLPVDPTGGSTDTVVYGCPFLVRDGQYSLGSASIALDHNDHNMVAFTSLHGGASEGDPYSHSRGNTQVHTTFTSWKQGTSWADQPPAPSTEPSNEARGSDSDIAIDSLGNIYGAYLYHNPRGDTFDSIIHAFKAGPISHSNVITAYGYQDIIGTRDQGNHIERIHLLHLPDVAASAAPPADPNETAPSADPGEVGQAARPGDANPDERVIALWHETAADHVNGTTGLSGWVDAAWTDTGTSSDWHRLPEDQVIGPCSAGSNGVQWQGKAYVACVVDRGYADRARARIGDIDLWEIDPADNTTRLVGFTGMTSGGTVLMAQSVRDTDTYVGMLAWDRLVTDEGDLHRLEVKTGYAWLNTLHMPGGRLEVSPTDLGIQLRQWGEGGDDLALHDAHVTAFEMTDDTYQSILVYNEWHDDPQDIPEIGPDTDPLSVVDNRFTDYNKYVMAFNRCAGPFAGYEAQLGTSVDTYNAQQYAENTGIFNEPRDGLFKTREASTREELVYFALGDYGAIQYGALIVHDQSSFCTPPPMPPIAPVSVAPQALTTASGASHMMAASFAVPAAAMIGYLLTVKRRNAIHSAAEDP